MTPLSCLISYSHSMLLSSRFSELQIHSSLYILRPPRERPYGALSSTDVTPLITGEDVPQTPLWCSRDKYCRCWTFRLTSDNQDVKRIRVQTFAWCVLPLLFLRQAAWPVIRPHTEDQSVGYGVVIGQWTPNSLTLEHLSLCFLGVGFFFAGIMLVLTFLQSKFSKYSPSSSEEFSVRWH